MLSVINIITQNDNFEITSNHGNRCRKIFKKGNKKDFSKYDAFGMLFSLYTRYI